MRVRIKSISRGPLTKKIKIANIKYIRKAFLDQVGKIGVKFIKEEISKRKWKAKGAAARVKKSIFNYVPPSAEYVSFGSNKPYIVYQEKGVKKQPMKWLLGLNKPLGPMMFHGKKTFRWAPKNSSVFAQGKWIHPGFKPKRFFEVGVKRTKQFVEQKDKGILNSIVGKILKGRKT